MLISKETCDRLNELTAMCFNANAVFDNLAYSLDYHYLANIAKVVHLSVAHIMPEWADLITDEMLRLGGRPVRKPIGGYEQDYVEPSDVFATMQKTFSDMRTAVRSLIESADLDGDDEARIFCEEFLAIMTPFIKQADEWANAAAKLSVQDLNIHIECYTHFIPIK